MTLKLKISRIFDDKIKDLFKRSEPAGILISLKNTIRKCNRI